MTFGDEAERELAGSQPADGGDQESQAPVAGETLEPAIGQGPAAGSTAAAPAGDVAAARRELAERTDQLLRVAADFENFRRRRDRELAERSRYAAEEAVRALLPVLDNLRLAISHAGRVDAEEPAAPPVVAPPAPGVGSPSRRPAGARRGPAERPAAANQSLQDGLRMVVAQFEQALAGIGVEPVPTVGARFDPTVHEAIGGEESDEVSEDTVIAEVQPGYRLHDRLLRPALVRVAHPRAPALGSA
ncbi:MAG TPA: nucleotide exchange factor GrpE [Candidatus Binatia bacterium]|nr:nucleotide exchange factor GrpE [Candidatus Binatia bacterium]